MQNNGLFSCLCQLRYLLEQVQNHSKLVDLARKYYTHVVSCSCSVSPLQVYDTLVNEDRRCSSFQW
ncbi:hypothetical protein GIB67_005052 [Kingdonia uniflora]|uniref:Uncharacterized protein n=1 Tax=Kingdonia uniflora TaxID=39325 RepID=A0A7J7PBH0_9MAGN|nr:hypothetical protein GIB67_005052 [Kingdonia uniflora]